MSVIAGNMFSSGCRGLTLPAALTFLAKSQSSQNQEPAHLDVTWTEGLPLSLMDLVRSQHEGGVHRHWHRAGLPDRPPLRHRDGRMADRLWRGRVLCPHHEDWHGEACMGSLYQGLERFCPEPACNANN